MKTSLNNIKTDLDREKSFTIGGRNNYLFEFAYRAKSKGYNQQEVIDFSIANFKQPDFTDFEIISTIKGVYSYSAHNSSHIQQSVEIQDPILRVTLKDFDTNDKIFWDKYGISEEVLNTYKIVGISSFQTKAGTVFCRENDPIYAIEVDPGECYFLYRPFNQKYKFRWLGSKPSDFIFGLNQLPETGESVFLTGGLKDTLCLRAHGYAAFTLNSETSSLNPELYQEISKRFKQFFILYDTDETGLKKSELISQKFHLPRIILPNMPFGKDVSDYFSHGGTTDELNRLIHEAEIATPVEENEKMVYTSVELVALGDQRIGYIVEPIIQRVGAAVLAGMPDAGKSQFARQLAVQIALGMTEFLGFKLTPIHYKSIYIATEDGIDATRFLHSQQLKGLGKETTENLRFLFADMLEPEEVVNKLEHMLTEAAVDLVVVDGFGDVFMGKDSNSNMPMRNTAKVFSRIAAKYSCLILLIHHVNKSAYKLSPGQQHIQGGSGLVQKVRLVLQLTIGDGDIRYLTVVKGNYCPREYKTHAIELLFSEVNFLFIETGRKVPIDSLGEQTEKPDQGMKMSKITQLANEIFRNQALRYNIFIEEYERITNQKIAQAKRFHKQLRDLDLIEECQGGWRLKEFQAPDNDENEKEPEEDPESGFPLF